MKRSTWLGIALMALSLLGEGCAKSREAAERGTQEFRRRVASGEFATIYKEAAPEFQKISAEANFAKFMERIGRKLGMWRSSQPPASHESSGTRGRTVTLTYASHFENGDAGEEFLWRIEGERPILVGYHINSPLLLPSDFQVEPPPNPPQ
jgi:hypothetical protein